MGSQAVRRRINSLMVRLRLIFLFLLLLMGVLLTYQLNTAGHMLSEEIEQQRRALSRSLDTWLMDAARYHVALIRGLPPYSALLSRRLEEGNTLAVGDIVHQLQQNLSFFSVLLLDDTGRAWNHAGGHFTAVRWPDWLARQPLRKVMLRLIRPERLPEGWRSVFPQSGLYSVIKVPVHDAVGDQLGTLVLVRRQAEVGRRVPYLSGIMRDLEVQLMLTRPADVAERSPWRLLREVADHAVMTVWVNMPAYVQNGEGGGFVWRQPTVFFRNLLNNVLTAVLLPFGVFFLALAALFWYLSRKVVRPLERLAELFRQLHDGARGVRMPQDGYAREVAYVVEQTNRMLDRLDEREQSLQTLNSTLEQQVSQRTRQLEEINRKLREVAYLDPLTGLSNRLRFEQRWAELQAHDGLILALVDIDFFRDLNDAYGSEVGNRVLQRLGMSLRHLCDDETAVEVFRLGADEFALLFDASAYSGTRVQQCLERLQQQFAATPLRQLGLNTPLMLSASWVEVPADAALPLTSVLRQAELAKRAAKHDLNRKVQRFDPQLHRDDEVVSPQAMHDLMRLVRRGEGLVLMCQPVVSAADGEPQYAEVLARFERDGQLVPPGQFFPLIERAGLQAAFDEQVLAAAARMLQEVDFPYDGVSLNLTPQALAHEALFDWLAPLVPLTERYTIVLEITESTLIHDLSTAQEKLRRFRRLGFKVAIDDFGSGYSSISYLAHLSADTIKFDRSLAVAAFEDARSARIVLGLAEELSTLGYQVVFEGIETAEMANFFHQPFVHCLQGFFFARPQPCRAQAEAAADDDVSTDHSEDM